MSTVAQTNATAATVFLGFAAICAVDRFFCQHTRRRRNQRGPPALRTQALNPEARSSIWLQPSDSKVVFACLPSGEVSRETGWTLVDFFIRRGVLCSDL